MGDKERPVSKKASGLSHPSRRKEGNSSNQERREEKGNSPFLSSVYVPYVQTLDEKLATLGIEIGTAAGSQTPSTVNFAGSGRPRSKNSVPVLGYLNQQVMASSPISPASGRSGGSLEDSGISRESSDMSGRRSSRLNSDINKKISEISTSMDQYDKKVKNVSETMHEAYRKSVHDMKTRKISSRNASPRPGTGDPKDSAETFLAKCRDDLKSSLNLGSTPTALSKLPPKPPFESPALRSPRKVFGLDAAALLKSSSSSISSNQSTSGSESEDTSRNTAGMKVSIRNTKTDALKRFQDSKAQNQPRPAKPKQKKKAGKGDELEGKIRSLSPIMPTLPDKQFATILERREERVSRHLNTMKNELAQLNQKVEMDKRKAEGSTSSRKGLMETSYQGRPMRLMQPAQDKNVGNEFNQFLQTTGGKAGGWERKDHMTFVKTFDVWRKHPNKLMEALRKELPDKKPKEIASHIKWYERFQELSSSNKADVHKWAIEKRRENELVFQMGSESQRAKLEGEKRRQEHLKMVREQERDKTRDKLAQWKRNQSHSVTSTAEQRPRSNFQEDNGSVDIAGVRQHILDITARVHSLDNPKRDFRPPRPLPSTSSTGNKQIEQGLWRKPGGFSRYTPSSALSKESSEHEDTQQLGYQSRQSSATATAPSLRGRTRLPEIEPDARSSRPASRHNLQSRVAEFRDRDNKLVEAKKKAVEIARERRKASYNQLTAEDIRRRIRSRQGPSTILNPTKQSELRKSLTHLERLEMLSKQDLSQLGQPLVEPRFDPALPPISAMPSKGVPSWRKGAGDYL